VISKRPSIITAQRPIVQTSTRQSVRPQITIQLPKPPIESEPERGPCILCGDGFRGPEVVRLKHGCVRQRKWGAEFLPLPFEDHEKLKWLCFTCALDSYVLSDDGTRFSTHLDGLNTDGQCCLCKRVIEPYPLEDWSSAILIELGAVVPGKRGFSIFRPKMSGHVHYLCMDDIHLELWRLVDRSDVPNYEEYLSSCE
jgi:hypothetical protein